MLTPSNKQHRMMDVLPNWFRLRNNQTGDTMDFDSRNAEHMKLYAYFEDNPEWVMLEDKRVQPLAGDEPTEPFTPV